MQILLYSFFCFSGGKGGRADFGPFRVQLTTTIMFPLPFLAFGVSCPGQLC